MKKIIYFLIITMTFMLLFFSVKDKIVYYQAKVKIIEYLKKNYGDGDYIVSKSEPRLVCDVFNYCENSGYVFTMKTKYFDKKIKVYINKDNYIVNENFIDLYTENWSLGESSNLTSYLHFKYLNEVKEKISNVFNVQVLFDTVEIKPNFGFKNQGRIPQMDDFYDSVVLVGPRLKIEENITSKKEMIEYLKKLVSFFEKDLRTEKIKYTDKYFAFEYDYSKMGINDELYKGFSGSIKMGKYAYKNKKLSLIKEDNSISFIFLGEVYNFAFEDIIKE